MSELHRVRRYIQESNYDAAREVLRTLPDRAEARKWLDRIDGLAASGHQRTQTDVSSEYDIYTPEQDAYDDFLAQWVAITQLSLRFMGSAVLLFDLGLIAYLLIMNPLYRPPASYPSYYERPASAEALAGTFSILFLIIILGLAALGFYLISRSSQAEPMRTSLPTLQAPLLRTMSVIVGVMSVVALLRVSGVAGLVSFVACLTVALFGSFQASQAEKLAILQAAAFGETEEKAKR